MKEGWNKRSITTEKGKKNPDIKVVEIIIPSTKNKSESHGVIERR